MTLELVAWTFFLLLFPFAAHAGAIGGDRWRPEPKKLLGNRIGRFLVRRMNLILLTNGVFVATAYLLWRLVGEPYSWAPLVLSIPTVAAQLALAAASAAQSN